MCRQEPLEGGGGVAEGAREEKAATCTSPRATQEVPPGEGYLWLPRLPHLVSDSPGSAKFAEVFGASMICKKVSILRFQ